MTNTWRSPGLLRTAAPCLCISRGGKKETHTVSPQTRSSCWHPCFLFPLFLIFLSARMPWLVICLSRQCFPVCHFPVNTINLWKLSWRSKTITRFVSLYMLETWQGRIVRRRLSVWKLGASSPKWPLPCSYTVHVVFSRRLETRFQAFLFTLWQKCSQRKLNIELWWLHGMRSLWEVAQKHWKSTLPRGTISSVWFCIAEKYPDLISGSNNDVKTYYANLPENSFDPTDRRRRRFLSPRQRLEMITVM